MSVSINGTGSITGIDQGFNVTSGSVGIGTDVVGDKLVIHQGSDDDVIVRVNGADSSSEFAAMGVGSGYAAFVAGGTGTTNTDMVLMTSLSGVETERLRITSAGGVGIGTDTPYVNNSFNSLSIGGSGKYGLIELNKSDGVAGSWIDVYGTNGNGDLRITTAGTSGAITFWTGGSFTEKVRITSDGTVKIGSNTLITPSTDADNFVIDTGDVDSGLSILSATTGRIYFGDAASTDQGSIRYVHTDDSMRFETNSSEKLRITSGGQVNIGGDLTQTGFTANITRNSSETDILRIKGNGGNAFVRFEDSDASSSFTLGADDAVGSGGFALYDRSDSAYRVVVDTDGKIGINDNSPAALLTVNNGTTDDQCVQIKNDNVGLFLGTYGTGHGSYPREATINGSRTDSGTHPFLRIGGQGGIKFCVDFNTERMRIKNNGHVHIGNSIELANVATTTHTFALSGNSDNTFSCPGSVAISGATAYNTANYAGGGLRFLGKYNAAGQYTTFAHVGGIKENTTDGNYAGALTFHTRNHGGLGAERMRISSNGQVTMPVQPCFWATSNTGGSNTSTGYTGIISNQLEAAYVNVGNHYNTSTGVFTCPVAGVYEFHGQGLIRYQGSDGRAELSFFKNGSNTISRSYGYTYVKGQSDHDNLHVMGYITCAANDQIDLRVYNMDSAIDCYFAQGLGYFAGRLVQ